MKKGSILLPLLAVLLLSFVLVLDSQEKKSLKMIPERYQKWLKEEVVYIITPIEEDVFLRLETDRERELFIEAFWKQRDPNPNTPENEFKKEHYRRINYANNFFGRESPGPGWRSDMGRVYITLGEPKSTEKYESHSEIYPTVIWFYEGMNQYGLPNAFNVVFFKESGMGEYKLYSPIRFGPQNILIHYQGDPTDYLSAYSQLLRIEPNVAEVSLSLIPGESAVVLSPSLASEILISEKIPSAPHKKIEDTYAEKLLKYKDFIEVDYTANYIGNDSDLKIIKDEAGTFFVHYIIEPRRLSLEQYQSKYHTNLEINGRISDEKGNTIYQYDHTIPVEFNDEQLSKIKAKLFSYQDMFPLIGGHYKFDVLLKNTVSREFTSIEKDIIIPEASALQMSSLTLANKIVKDSQYREKNKPFLIEDLWLVPSPRNDFSQEDTLYLFFQIYGMNEELAENGFLEYSIFKDNEKVYSSTKNIKEYPDRTNFLEEFSLSDLTVANYKMDVSLFDKNKKKILSEQSNFYISPMAFLPRPWILSGSMPSSGDPSYINILGNQFLNKKDIEKAKTLLEKAYQRNPNSVKFALDLCRALFMAKEYLRVKQIVVSFSESEEKYRFSGILGQACQALGEYHDAISNYKDFLSHYGTNLHVLNSIGECYYRLGNNAEALMAWEKSLELNPEQEEIKKIVESIKERK